MAGHSVCPGRSGSGVSSPTAGAARYPATTARPDLLAWCGRRGGLLPSNSDLGSLCLDGPFPGLGRGTKASGAQSMNLDQKRIVVTGVGAISPIGLSANESWNNAVNGVSGVGPITLFDTEDFLVKIACEVKDFNPADFMPHRVTRRRDRFQQFAVAAAKEAIEQSGLEFPIDDPGRVGTIVSAAIGGVRAFDEAILKLFTDGPRRINPFTIPMLMANGSSGVISIDYGFKGPSYSIASACASGADGIGTAWTLIRAGVIDLAVAGGSEATIR